ncbi:MAG: phage terminase large subunit [Gemmatimonadota bacterium]|nr:phage terminase large subunit [Gemmatimonadota bacterium]
MTLRDEYGETPREAFYGGAAGGGKSFALMMAAAQYVERPGYAALLLRRTYADLSLPDAIMDVAREWWGGSAARWVEDDKTWRFPSGATVTFGYLEYEKNKYRYQGSAYQFIAFDELSQFSETMYRYLFSRLRRKKDLDVPVRMRCASNPGGTGHEWVKQRFLIEKKPGRVFVPARLSDNLSIEQEEYRRNLDELDPVTRAQLLDGDWDVQGTGAQFRREWFEILEGTPQTYERVVRFWDTAATDATVDHDADWTVGVKMGKRPNGTFVILDVRRIQGTPRKVEELILRTAIEDGQEVEIYLEQEPGASGKQVVDHYAVRVLAGYSFMGIRATGNKVVRAAPLSSQAQASNVQIVRAAWMGDFLSELEGFPYGDHDDQVDAASGAFIQLTQGGDLRPATTDIRDMFAWRA